MNVLRRLRGLLGCILLGAIPWSLIGAAAFFAFTHGLIPGIRGGSITSNTFDNIYVAGAVFGGVCGAISGLIFGTLLFASERNRSVEEIRAPRFIVLGAIASASVFALMTGSTLITLLAGAVGGV